MLAGLTHSAGRVHGHQQWTDAVLLWQVAVRNGILVTFDAHVRELAGPGLRAKVLLLSTKH